MNSTPYADGQWSVCVVDVTTGETLVDYNSNIVVEPVSVTKTHSVGAARLKFGADHRIVMHVVLTGPGRTAVLSGDLLPGAPIAGNNPLAGLGHLARQVKASGIDRIGGNVGIDDRVFATRDLGVELSRAGMRRGTVASAGVEEHGAPGGVVHVCSNSSSLMLGRDRTRPATRARASASPPWRCTTSTRARRRSS